MFELYSQRIKNQEGESEVFIYNEFSSKFRNQFIYCVKDCYNSMEGKIDKINRNIDFFPDAYEIGFLCLDSMAELIYSIFKREKGLGDEVGSDWDDLTKYIQECDNTDFLDMMDLIAHLIFNKSKNIFSDIFGENIFKNHFSGYIDDGINHINLRLKENLLGYEIIDGKVIAKTNTVTHEHIIKPALKLLIDEDFRGAEEEYLLAFENFKNGENENAIINGNKAFESVLKTICGKLEYQYDPSKASAKKLLNILEENNFFPGYLKNHLSSLINSLETGAPVIRNKVAGHGQGENVRKVGDEYVEYVLNLTATNILFLYKIYKGKVAK